MAICKLLNGVHLWPTFAPFFVHPRWLELSAVPYMDMSSAEACAKRHVPNVHRFELATGRYARLTAEERKAYRRHPLT